MAIDTIVTGSKLTALANAIRQAGGTSSPLDLDDMPTAIAGIIPSQASLTKFALRETTYDSYYGSGTNKRNYDIEAADFGTAQDAGVNTGIAPYAFYASTNSYAFRLRSVEIPAWITSIGGSAFHGQKQALDSVTFMGGASDPVLTIGESAFYQTEKLIVVECFRPCNLDAAANAFLRCYALSSMEFNLASAATKIPVGFLRYCSSLAYLAFHHEGSALTLESYSLCCYNPNGNLPVILDTASMVTIDSNARTNVFDASNGVYDVYVRNSLLSTYEADSNWDYWANSQGLVNLRALSEYDPNDYA